MKYLFLFLLSITLVFNSNSCNKKDKNAESIAALTKKREKLNEQADKINKELTEINEQISNLQKVDQREQILPHTVSYQPFQHSISVQSTVNTDQNVMIFPEFAGSLRWYVKEGSKVSTGQVIGSIDDGGMSSQLQQARIQADLAKTAFEKQQRLWNEKIGSEIQYLQSKTAFDASQKSISAIESQLRRTKIKAPFSGTIDQLMMQSGQAVAPGVPLARIVNQSELKVIADISEGYIQKVKVGTPVQIELVGINEKIFGKISRVSSAINPNNRTFSIEIPISNKTGLVKPNMTAKLDIIDYTNKNAIAIPSKSIQVNANGEKYVYTLSDINGSNGTAKKSFITAGQSNGDYTEVLAGLKVGDIVVKDGVRSVVDGVKVKF